MGVTNIPSTLMTRIRVFELSLAHALLFMIAFPPFDIWPATFVSIMPLVAIVLRTQGPFCSARIVWVVSTVMWLFMQRWLIGVTVVGWPLLAMYLALYPAVFVWIGARLARRWPTSHFRLAIGLTVLWVGLETLRGEFMLTGYAWFLLAHPLIGTPLAPFASVTGVYGVSLLVALPQIILMVAFVRRRTVGAMLITAAYTGAYLILVVFLGMALFFVNAPPIDVEEHEGELSEAHISIRAPKLDVAVVQTNVPQSNKVGWPIEQRLADFEHMRELTLEAANRTATVRERLPESDDETSAHGRGGRATDFSPDLIIWPETMFPGDTLSAQAIDEMRRVGLGYSGGIDADYFNNELAALQQLVDTPMLIGAVGYDELEIRPDANGAVEFVHAGKYNSTFLVEDGVAIETRYDKLHLTPFGEVMPIISHFEWLENALLAIGAGGMSFDLDAGSRPVVFELPVRAPSASEGSQKTEISELTSDDRAAPTNEGGTAHRAVAHDVVRIVTPICFEAATPRVCRRLVFADGERQADLMVNLTNDGWFGDRRAGHAQHLQVARWRCIELRTPMVRAANTGISASIDTFGQVQDRGPDNRVKDWNVDGVMRTHVWLPGGPPTFYARYGDIVGWGCVLMSVITGIVALRPRKIEPTLQTDQERTDAANHEDQQ